MTCTRCRREFEHTALFCPNCGTAKARDLALDPLIGQRVGERFEIVERIGHGASGTIYRAKHISLPRKVAVKVLHHELCGNELAIERFRREATTVGNIDNDHIVQIYDFGRTTDDRLYLVMELLTGHTLDTLLKRDGPLPIPLVTNVLLQLGEGLSEAHSLGYVHRDLRPHNIYLAVRRGAHNFVKLLDFGLAKLVEGESQTTSLGMTFGEPRYMSPEQARGDATDMRSDIYSLGCIAYEMVVGEPPFQASRVHEVLSQHTQASATAPIVRRPDMPRWLNDAIMQMLAKSPADRFPTVLRINELLEANGATNAHDKARIRTATGSPIEETRVDSSGPSTFPDSGKTERTELDELDRAKTNIFRPMAAGKEKRHPETTGDDFRNHEEEESGISAAWFANNSLRDEGKEAELDQVHQAKLDEVRPAISVVIDPSTQSSAMYYTPKRSALPAIAWTLGIIGALLLLGTLLWPSGETPTLENDSPSPGAETDTAALVPPESEDQSPTIGTTDNRKPPRIAQTSRLRSRSTHKPGLRPSTRSSSQPTSPPTTSHPPATTRPPLSPTNATKANFYAKLGQTALRNNQLSIAQGHFRRAHELNPNSRAVQLGLGEIALRRRAFTTALYYLKPLSTSSKSARLLTLLGEAYLGIGKKNRGQPTSLSEH